MAVIDLLAPLRAAGFNADALLVDLDPRILGEEVGSALAAQATAHLLEHKTPGGDPLPPDKSGKPRGVRSGTYAHSWHSTTTSTGAMVQPRGELGQDDRIYGDLPLMTAAGMDTPRIQAAITRALARMVVVKK